MTTVYKCLLQHHEKNNFPLPSRNDLFNIERIVQFHFKNFWLLKQPTKNDLIWDCRMIIEYQFDKETVTQSYPDQFQDEIIRRAEAFFKSKDTRIADNNIPPSKKIRKRIPARSNKILSVKPSN